MSTTVINTDLGRNLEWYAYRNGHNTIKLLLKQNNLPFDLTGTEVEVEFYNPGTSTLVLALKESDSPATIINGEATGEITIPLTPIQIAANMKRDRYFYVVKYTKDSATQRLIQGYIILNKELNPRDTNTEIPVNITIGDNVVELNILAFGSEFDITKLTEEQLAQLWNALAPYNLGLS